MSAGMPILKTMAARAISHLWLIPQLKDVDFKDVCRTNLRYVMSCFCHSADIMLSYCCRVQWVISNCVVLRPKITFLDGSLVTANLSPLIWQTSCDKFFSNALSWGSKRRRSQHLAVIMMLSFGLCAVDNHMCCVFPARVWGSVSRMCTENTAEVLRCLTAEAST